MKKHAILQLMLSNPVFANILMAIFLGGGLVSMFFMTRESFPDFNLDLIQVTVIYPGADPDEIEESILLPMEDALEGIENVQRIYTSARDGVGVAVIEATERANITRIKDDVKTRIDTITTFPRDAERAIIEDIKFKDQVINIAVWGDLPEHHLKRVAQGLQDELLAMDEISQVSISGTRPEEIAIELSEATLREYGLTFAQVAAAVSASSLNLPAGTIRAAEEDLKLRIVGRRYWAEEFHSIIVGARPNGSTIYLRNIAQLRNAFDPEAESFARFNGQPAINLAIQKAGNEDAIEIARIVKRFIEEKRAMLPPTVHIKSWLDNARLIQDRIDLLRRNGLIGLGLVFLTLWFFLSFRLGFWVTLGIPISLGGAMCIMYFTGQSMNMISLFGMIMVLGIIVDDAIVVGESIYAKQELGLPGPEAAVSGTAEVIWPVLTAICTTIVAFIPLFYVSGVIGKFIGVMPGPVVAALIISLFEALLILPVHLRHGRKAERQHFSIWHLHEWLVTRIGRLLNWFIERVYGPGLDVLLRWRYATTACAVAILLVMLGLVAGGFVKFIFFPEADDDFIRATIEMPHGTPIEATSAITEQLLQGWEKTRAEFADRLSGHDLGQAVYSVTGGTVGSPDQPARSGNHLTEIFVELLPAETRGIYYKEIIAAWRRHAGPLFGASQVTFEGLGGGPPGGNVSLDLMGDNHERLVQAATELQGILTQYQGVYEINSDYQPGKRELRISLKPEARALGLTLQDLASQLRFGFFGAEVGRIHRGRDEVKIMVRYLEPERQTLAQLERLRIRTADGEQVPFMQVADLQPASGFASIRRQERTRVIGIQAEVDATGNVNEIMADVLQNVIPKLRQKYNISARRGWDAEQRVKSIRTMVMGAIIAIMVIYLIMATVFKSYVQPAIILVSMPLGLIGAFLGHLLYGLPLTMMSFFGMVALMGIVVNDAIVLIVGINDRMATMSFMDALREGGKRRFRPILLTTLTTFAGLFPLILEKSFQAQFLIPMALSIAFGVIVATFSTLIVVPCLLAILNDLERLTYFGWYKHWPSRRDAARWQPPPVPAEKPVASDGSEL